jgi:flagellar hook assembly protein FlgD
MTITGKIVKSIQQTVRTEGNRIEPIEWDGRDDFGDKLARGTYIYRVKIQTPDQKYAEKIEKLVILN